MKDLRGRIVRRRKIEAIPRWRFLMPIGDRR